MNITIHLFGSPAGWAIGILALMGLSVITSRIWEWLDDRIAVDILSARIRRRWDRPGARVILADGRRGVIRDRVTGWDAPAMAIVQSGDGEDGEPEWVDIRALSPSEVPS